MANEVEKIFVDEYNTNLRLLAQQRNSRFEMCVMSGPASGESMSPVDQADEISMSEKTSRHQPITLAEVDFDRRWVRPTTWWDARAVDNDDKLKMKVSPDSSIIASQVAAGNRKKDDVIIESFFDTALTGRSGATSTTFPAGNIVAVNEGAAADTGMNVTKLKEARRIILASNVDLDDPDNAIYCALTAKLETDLLGQIEVVNTDYRSKPVLDSGGRLQSWFGINFVYSERLTVDANADIEVPFWCKSGMHLGKWQDFRGKMDVRLDIVTHPVQMYADMVIGATRTEEAKVVKILCDPTV